MSIQNVGWQKCAIGRYIPEENYSLDIELVTADESSVFILLPKEIQELGKDFLRKCQRFHDTDDYWDKKGLTELGSKRKQEIIKEFCQ